MNENIDTVVEAPSQTRKRKGPPKLLIALAVVIALVVTCGGAVAYFFLDAVAEVDDVEAVVSDFLMKTSSGDIAGAYGHFSSEVTETLTFDSFRDGVQRNGAYHDVEKLKRQGWRKSIGTGRPTLLTYQATVGYADGSKGDLHAELVREEDVWKIRFIQVNGGAGSFQ
ncbi:MAG: hypothetical protein AB7P33_05020 [Dehalococcoidia bacterium]